MDGCIVRIRMRNFLTFHELTVKPNQHLNLVTGPNGTGKSSLMCALCLGLGGKPKIVGRASSVSDFIRYNAEKASVEIELVNTKGVNYVVTREILRDNKSTWTLGGFSCTQKEVEALSTRLNIQMDNLCQFLPQERVQDFAKMNSVTLLENTEKCIGGMEMWENHVKLKLLGSMYLEKEKSLNTKREHLANEEQIFNSLQAAVDKMTSKRALLKKIEVMKQKLALLIYEASLENLAMSEDVVKKKVAARKAIEEQHKPMEGKLSKARKKLIAVEEKLKDASSAYSRLSASTEALFELTENINDECRGNVADFERFAAKEKRRIEKLKDIQTQISLLENMLEQLEGSGVELMQREAKLREDEKAGINQLASIEKEKDDVKVKINNIEHMINKFHSEAASAKKVDDEKLKKMGGLSEPVEWFNNNKHRLRGKAYEPMALVIKMKDKSMAKYLECIVARRDLTAFVCELPEDTSFLLKELREKLKYKVSVITSMPNTEMSSFCRPYEISTLQTYGFYCFVSDIFTAPETITRYLYKIYNVHKIPIGDSTTFMNADKVPKDIRIFLTDNKRFIYRKSRYTNESLSSSSSIYEASLLNQQAGDEIIKECMKRSSELQEELVQLVNVLSSITSKEKTQNECVRAIRKSRSEMKASLNKLVSTKSRLDNMRRNEADLVSEQCSEEDQKKKLENLNQKCTQRMIAALDQNVGNLVKLGDIIMKFKLTQCEIGIVRKNVTAIENELRSIRQKLRDAERDEGNSKESYEEAKHQCRRHLRNFEELAKLKFKSKEYHELLKTFSEFPDSLTELEREINDTHAKAECLGHSDGNVIREYERRQTTIAAFKKVIDQLVSDLTKDKKEIDELKSKWLPFVNELVSRIDKTFGDLLSKINYVGEVNLVQGQNEYDFANYGLKIKVKFRQEGGLQELNQFRQSGGERAVAIAIYLMSMQELTSVPFRCVDEINQGMDEYHEAVVFKLLSDIVSKTGSAQYFIFTPKVLRTLKFSETLMFTCVLNGVIIVEIFDSQKYVRNKKGKEAKRISL